MDNDILERLAELEHDQWCDWAGALSGEIEDLLRVISKLHDNSDFDLDDGDIAVVENSKERLVRWDSLMVPYSELSEEMKESDRVYARKILDLLDER
ncbi:hypothetical protein [Methanobrevibacter sp.]|uniref:hypothetical protein n=1 Tax=Methanobrevibacter sp. TaxID=66852 RepID=UPI00386B79DF